MHEPSASTAARVIEDTGERAARARASAEEADRQLRRFVHERPLTALLGAVIAGYLVARVTRVG